MAIYVAGKTAQPTALVRKHLQGYLQTQMDYADYLMAQLPESVSMTISLAKINSSKYTVTANVVGTGIDDLDGTEVTTYTVSAIPGGTRLEMEIDREDRPVPADDAQRLMTQTMNGLERYITIMEAGGPTVG